MMMKILSTMYLVPNGLIIILVFFIYSSHSQDLTNPKVFLESVLPILESTEVNEERLWFEWATNITNKTEENALRAEQLTQQLISEILQNETNFNISSNTLSFDTRRQLMLLKRVTVPPLKNEEESKELGEILARMQRKYSSWKICLDPKSSEGECKDLEDLQELRKTMTTSRNYTELLEIWTKWREKSATLRRDYINFVKLSNKGATEIGFKDTKDLWLNSYDMNSREVVDMVDNLWEQVKPLYTELHCHVREQLKETYKGHKFSSNGMIEAHLLGNMWGQQWNVYDIVAPFPSAGSVDITGAMNEQNWNWTRMVKQAEFFFTSLGMDPLPSNFWTKSMFLQPNRTVVCHASAWDLGKNETTGEIEVRLKACIQVNQEFFYTVHHELGHIFYYMQYAGQPYIYRDDPNDGFHEGIGDTMALSITTEYLKNLNLLPTDYSVNDNRILLNQQMNVALDKIAFLPFGLLVDKWRWGVFSGEIEKGKYNQAWWEFRQKYQGLVPPLNSIDHRVYDESLFDAASKSHICDNTPYLRYFLSYILQFQFHKALCKAANHTGPLHTCSINGSTKAGTLLKNMLSMGRSKPWQNALEQLTGSRNITTDALLEYFSPLHTWLKEQNRNRTCGWDPSLPYYNPTGYYINADRIAIILIGIIILVVSLGSIVFMKIKEKKIENNNNNKEDEIIIEREYEMNELEDVELLREEGDIEDDISIESFKE